MRRKGIRTWLFVLVGMTLCLPLLAEKRYALLIASGEFAPNTTFHEKPLKAPQNDVRLLASLLTWRFGFTPSSVTLIGVPTQSMGKDFRYASSHASFVAIEQAFQALKRMVKPEDVVVVYYSGHGTRILDPTAKQLGYQYEALVTYEATQATLIRDVLLRSWLSSLRSKRVCMVLDTCYAAGASRDISPDTWEGLTFNYVSKGVSGKNLTGGGASPSVPDVATDTEPPYMVLAACGRREKAQELRLLPIEGRSEIAVSAFTLALCRTLFWERGELTYTQLLERVQAKLKQLRLPQKPEVLGAQAGQVALAPQMWRGGAPRFPLARKEPPLLNVGILAGVRSTMRFDEMGAGGSQMEAVNPDWFTAELKLLNGKSVQSAFVVLAHE